MCRILGFEGGEGCERLLRPTGLMFGVPARIEGVGGKRAVRVGFEERVIGGDGSVPLLELVEGFATSQPSGGGAAALVVAVAISKPLAASA